MLIYTLLLVNAISTSTLATQKETHDLGGKINADENFVRAVGERRVLKNPIKEGNDSRDARNVNIFRKHSTAITGAKKKELELIYRKKRGLASILFLGGTTLLTVGSLAVNLANTIMKGCLFYPSICSNKERMENLERRLESMRFEYDKLYLENKKEYLNIATANTNNAYISYYINNTIQNIYTLEKYEMMLTESLQSQYPKLHEMYESSQKYTSEEYLDNIIGHLEYRLSDIRDIIQKQTNLQLKMIIIQAAVSVAYFSFKVGYKAASKKVLEKELKKKELAAQQNKNKDETKQSDETKHTDGTKHKDKTKLNQKNPSKPINKPTNPNNKPIKSPEKPPKRKGKFSIVRKTFSNVLKAKDKLLKIKDKIASTKVVKTLKYMIKNPLKTLKSVLPGKTKPKGKPIENMDKQNTVLSSQTKKIDKKQSTFAKMKKFKLKASTVVMGVIGIIAEIATQVGSVLSWKSTAAEVQKARDDYEKHFRKFERELKKVKKAKIKLAQRWAGIMLIFKNSTSVFEELMQSATNYTNFNSILGISKLPINTTDPIFHIDYQALTRTNIQKDQEKVIGFIKAIDNDVMKVVDQMFARKVMFDKILTMTMYNNTVDDIFKSITDTYMYSKSVIGKEFGKKLTKKDLMCTISLLRLDLSIYDFFQLDMFRPECKFAMSAYKTNEENATKQRNVNLLNVIVIKTLMNNKTSPTLIDLTAYVKNAYFAKDNIEMSSYGNTLTERDVICTIATKFPSKQEFDFISLIPFRPDCKNVNQSYFLTLKKEAQDIRYISLRIQNTLEICNAYNFCPCSSQIAIQLSITEDQVINLIRSQAPEMKQYCGLQNVCKCVKLK